MLASCLFVSEMQIEVQFGNKKKKSVQQSELPAADYMVWASSR